MSPDLKNKGFDTKTFVPPTPFLEKGSAENFWGVFLNLFIYLFLAVLGLHCCADFSLVAVSRGYSLVEVCGLLTVAASLAVELWL